MAIFTRLEDWRRSVRNGYPARVLAVLFSGSLNQKVIVLIGLAAAVYGAYTMLLEVWTPLIIGAVGFTIVGLAVKDFERAGRVR